MHLPSRHVGMHRISTISWTSEHRWWDEDRNTHVSSRVRNNAAWQETSRGLRVSSYSPLWKSANLCHHLKSGMSVSLEAGHCVRDVLPYVVAWCRTPVFVYTDWLLSFVMILVIFPSTAPGSREMARLNIGTMVLCVCFGMSHELWMSCHIVTTSFLPECIPLIMERVLISKHSNAKSLQNYIVLFDYFALIKFIFFQAFL